MDKVYAPFFPGDREMTEEEVLAERGAMGVFEDYEGCESGINTDPKEWERMAQEEQNLQQQWDDEED